MNRMNILKMCYYNIDGLSLLMGGPAFLQNILSKRTAYLNHQRLHAATLHSFYSMRLICLLLREASTLDQRMNYIWLLVDMNGKGTVKRTHSGCSPEASACRSMQRMQNQTANLCGEWSAAPLNILTSSSAYATHALTIISDDLGKGRRSNLSSL